MASEYDALLEPPSAKSEYDALLADPATTKPEESAPTWAQNAVGGLIDTAKALVPRSLRQAVDLVTPLGGAAHDLESAWGTIRDLAHGKNLEETARANYPESFVLADAEKTQPFSRERFASGFGMLANIGMLAGGVKGGLHERLAPILEEKPVLPTEVLPTPEAAVVGLEKEIPLPEPIITNESLTHEQIEPAGTGTPAEATATAGSEAMGAGDAATQPAGLAGDVAKPESAGVDEVAPPPKFKGPPGDSFGTELTPVSSAIINDLGGLMSKTAARRAGLYDASPELWDGAPQLHPTHGKIYASEKVGILDKKTGESKGTRSVGKGGQTPDKAAAELYDMGLIHEPTPDAMWDAVRRESQNARTTIREERAAGKAAEAAHADWQSQLKEGETDPALQLLTKDGDTGLVIKSPGGGVALDVLNGFTGEYVSTKSYPTLEKALRAAHEEGMRIDDGSEKGQSIFDESASHPSTTNAQATQEANAAQPPAALPGNEPTAGGISGGGSGGDAGSGVGGSGGGDELGSGETPQQSPTGIRNAIVDKQRVERGLPERMAPIRKTNPQAWDAAMSKIDQNPLAGRELVERIAAKPEALTPEDSALLAHETVTRENAFDSAVEDVNKADSPEALAEAKQRLARARDDVQQLYDVGQRAGTESGQSLQARKMMVNQDYSLAKMEATKRAVANDGKPLSEAQLAEVKAAHDKIAELQAKLDEHENAVSQTKQLELYKQIVKESLGTAKENAKAGRTLQETLDSAAAKARDRIIARRGRLYVTVDPLNVAGLVDEAIIGASHIARGLTKFADWSAQMVKDFGERINPYLKDLYDRAKQYHDAHARLFEKGGDKGTVADALGKITPDGALTQKQVYDLARAHVNAGVEGLDAVMKKVTDDLQATHHGITEREVRDTFTDYGKVKVPSAEEDKAKLREYRRLGQLVSAIEDAQNKEAPKKSGTQRDKPSQAIREKMKELQKAMRENGIETTSPEEQLASTNQARATALRNQIEDLEKEIATGERKTSGVPKPDTPEVTALKVKRDALKEQLAGIREADPAYMAEQDAKALSRYKTSIQKRTAEIQDRVAKGDYAKREPNRTQFDDEAMKLKAEYQRARDEFDAGVERDRLAKRGPVEKTLDALAKWRRAFVLSSPVTLAKLTSAAFERMAFTPMEEAIGAGISKVIPSVAERAPREGGVSVKAEAKALTEGFTKGMKDAWDVIRTGKSDLDALYGKRDIVPRKGVELIGSLHGALKTVTKRNEFARSFQKRVESAMANGIDTSDPLVQTRLAVESYKDANRSIFMQDNRVVAAYRRGVAALEQPDKATGKPTLGGKLGATAAKIVFPIVRIPTNIVAETLQYATGTVTGSVRLANAFAKGIDNLPPEHADLIMRDLKKGSLGAAALLIGYLNADKIGGYYQPREKRSEGDVKPTRIRVMGYDIPSYLVHNPLLETLQIGATIRRVADSKLKKDGDKQGIPAGVTAAALGLVEEVPFVRQTLGEFPKLLDAHERDQFMGEFSKSLVVPQGVQWLANQTDKRNGETVKRKPETFGQHIESGIPGLRQNVPEKIEKKRR